MNWCVFRWRQRFSRSWSRCRSCSTKGKFTSCFKKSDLLPKSEGLHTPPKKHHKILNFLVLNWPCNSYTLSTAFFCPLSVSSISEDFLVWSRSWSFAPHISTWHSLELNLVKHNYFTVSVSVCVELWETHRHVTIRNMEPLCCCCMNRWVPKTLRTHKIFVGFYVSGVWRLSERQLHRYFQTEGFILLCSTCRLQSQSVVVSINIHLHSTQFYSYGTKSQQQPTSIAA